MKPAIYPYIRWSSDEQSNGDSERRQTEGARQYAQRQGWTISDANIIVDGDKSAWTGENLTRGRLGQVLKDVEAGHYPKGSIFIVEDMDRLSRQGSDAYRDIVRTFTKA